MIRYLAACAITANLTVAQAAPPEGPKNLFRSLLGVSEAETDARIHAAWRQLTEGDPDSERLYFETSEDTAFIKDIGNNDVRSEGMSYGMMIAVQLNQKEQFDRLWKWTVEHMQHRSGPRRGYFAWQCLPDGTMLAPGVSASDGEEWIAMALFFAAHRWGDGEGLFAYSRHAQDLLREMLHKKPAGIDTAIFNREHRQVVFCPIGKAATFTDPSYHLPHFYTLWARWAEDPEDRAFWQSAAVESREFFRRAANPQTGLMPEYAHFDGRPVTDTEFGPGRNEFAFDAWRTLSHVALDYVWGSGDAWQVEQSNRVLRFLRSQGDQPPNRYSLDGKPVSRESSPGLLAMAASAGLAADPDLARPFVEELWKLPMPSGKWRYYDGLLTMLGLLQAGGRFQIFHPPSQ